MHLQASIHVACSLLRTGSLTSRRSTKEPSAVAGRAASCGAMCWLLPVQVLLSLCAGMGSAGAAARQCACCCHPAGALRGQRPALLARAAVRAKLGPLPEPTHPAAVHGIGVCADQRACAADIHDDGMPACITSHFWLVMAWCTRGGTQNGLIWIYRWKAVRAARQTVGSRRRRALSGLGSGSEGGSNGFA